MSKSRFEKLKSADHRHVWHPFTQMQTWLKDDPLIIERGEGNYLIDIDGKRYLDGVSSLWCNVHGHRKAELDDALRRQLELIAHSTMLGLSHVPGIELAEALSTVTGLGLNKVFFSDSGAEAVEVAARMVLQYWQLMGEPRRRLFVTLTEAYHGDTLGSVSLGYSERFHRHLQPVLFPTVKVDPPHVFRFYKGQAREEAEHAALAAARELLDRHSDELAALVIEPLVQGAAGIWDHSAAFLRGIIELVRARGGLVVCDEVATGFGRTGALLACAKAKVEPDLLCLGKGITGGYLPLAATLAGDAVYDAFLGEPQEYKAFYYGHTYTGNPLASAVALANLKLFEQERIIERIQPRIAQLEAELSKRVAPLEHVADIRQCGLMVGIELMRDAGRRLAYAPAEQIGAQVIRAARRRDIAIRPLGDIVVLMPPLSIEASELEQLVDGTGAAIAEITGERAVQTGRR